MYKLKGDYNSGDTALICDLVLGGGLSSETYQTVLSSLGGSVLRLLLGRTGDEGIEMIGASVCREVVAGGGVWQRSWDTEADTIAGSSNFFMSAALGLTVRDVPALVLFVLLRLVSTF